MKPPNFPRRRYLIDPLQYRIMLTGMLYVVAVVLVFAGVVFLPLAMAMDMQASDSTTVSTAAREFLSLHNRVWPPVLALLILLVAHNIFFSHRIAGPLYRFRSDLKRVGDGNLFVNVRLRKNDYLEKEAASINEMVESLRTKIRAIEHNQKRASAVLIDIQKALVRGAADQMADQIDDLGEVLALLKENVDQFQVPREVARASDAAIMDKGAAKSTVQAARAEVPTGI
jgi:methyl-accepting chemotaxis protein